MLRPAVPADSPALIALATATGIFQPGEAEALLGGVLEELHAGRLADGHQTQVWQDGPDAPPAGWVYFAPTPNANGVWDLWWIGVDPARQGRGIGGELLGFVEAQVRSAGGRLLIIETSSTPAFDPVRRFYFQRGYAECGRVPDFYADGDGKVICAKRLTAPAGGA
jgi:ribosomal protein S18 acetylase RimI-like enzyme